MIPILLKDLGTRKYSNRNRRFGLYQCPFCNNSFECSSDNVKQGYKKSCGCVSSKLKGDFHITHNLKNHKLYKVWSSMKQRCNNLNSKSFKNYGARGIKVCNEWENDFKAFYDWAIKNGYKDGLSIERENNNGNYGPLNCIFATMQVQNCNKRYFNSGYIGVSNQGNRYIASLSIDNKKLYIGSYKTELEAALARDNYILVNKLNNKLNFGDK